MSGTSSIGGLVSGLDTASLVDQLMRLEAQTQTRLKSRLASAQSDVKALQELNAKFVSLGTLATDLAKTTAWNPVGITSSTEKVTATAGATTLAGPVRFTVGHTALNHQLSFTDTAALATVVTSGSTMVRIDRLDGTTQDIDTGDGTLGGLIAALNAPSTGLRASTIRLDDGTFRLQVGAAASGAASDFTLTNLDGSALLGGAAVTAGRDAEITIGTDTVHSATNTFTGIVNGISITLKPDVAAGTVVDLAVSSDAAAMATKVQSYVDAVNDVLARIDALSGYNPATKTSGPLAGDAVLRDLRNRLVNSVYPADGGSLASVGVQLDRSGKLVFDQAKFTTAFEADRGSVAAAFTSGTPAGFAARVGAVAKLASDSVDGIVTTAIASRTSGIERLQDGIEVWDTRLALRRDHLNRQFSLLETTLSRLNSQSNWLSGQISSLSTPSD